MWTMLAVTMATMVAPAHANDEDKAACAELEEGDECVDHNGRDGTCVPDDDEPVLTCESNEDLGDDGTDDTGTDDTGTDSAGGSGGGDADKLACEGAVEGDACIDHNGRDGTCVPDDSDPVLTCESNEDLQERARIPGSASCSTGALSGVGAGGALGALVLLSLARRRTRA